MPSIADIKRDIIGTTGQDWEFFDGPTQVYTFKQDPHVRMEQDEEFDEGYPHSWTEIFPDHRNDATSVFTLYYGTSPIDTFSVVWTDGGRFQLPNPRIQNPREDDPDDYKFALSRYQASIGRVMSIDEFDDWFPLDRVEILSANFH